MRKLVLTILLFVSVSFSAFAQSYSVNSDESKVTITGTSTLHDWESVAETIDGSATIIIQEEKLEAIEGLTFDVVSASIKSGKGGMDKKTHGALDAKKHPKIVFNLADISSIEDGTLMATGNLTIAGQTKPIELTVGYELKSNGSIVFTGTKPITMSDYGIDPPTAVFGTIKAGDDVQVHFEVEFTLNK